MYLWYFKKKGVNVGNPRHKNTVLGSDLCCHNREMLAKSANIWLLWRHVTGMSATFPAKRCRNYGVSKRWCCSWLLPLMGRGCYGWQLEEDRKSLIC